MIPKNIPPNADAGRDQTVKVKEKVLLSAHASYDEDGDDLTYAWSFKSKPTDSVAKIEGADQAECFFIPDKPGKYVILLKVNDGIADGQDEVIVTAEKGQNFPPEAKVGEDQIVATGATVQLDGSKSSDPNQDELIFKWTLTVPTGSQAKLDDPASKTPKFTADVAGDYEATLIVNDGEVNSQPATVKIKAVDDFDKEPKVTSLDPPKVPTDTISEIRVLGSQLVKGAVVLFRNREITTTYVSASELKVKLELIGVPAGKYPLIVKNPNNKTSAPVDLEVSAVPNPTITSLSPAKAGSGTRFTLKVNGSGFVTASKVFFTGTELKTKFVSEKLLEAEINLKGIATGSYPIVVQNPGGKQSTPVHLEVTPPPPPPEITILNPDTGKSGTKIDFTVFGKRFDANSVILFDGKPIPTKSVGGGELKADPKLDLTQVPAGTYQVKVRDSFGLESKPENFTVTDKYPIPKLISLSPSSATTENIVTVTINGNFFDPQAKAFFNNKPVAKTVFKSANALEITLDLKGVAPTRYPVYVENPGPSAGSPRKSNVLQFTVTPLPPPSITSVSYAALYSNQQGAILVHGKGFTPSTVVETSTRGQRYSSSSYCSRLTFVARKTTYVSSTQLLAVFVMPNTTSSYNWYHGIRVARGTIRSNALCFRVNYSGTPTPPTISSLNPVAVAFGTQSPVAVQIRGVGFDVLPTVMFNKKKAVKATYRSSSQIDAEFDITGIAAGTSVDVQVINASGKQSGIAKFSILKKGQPLLQSVSPSTIYAGNTYTLTLNGSGFDPKAVVHADGKPISGTTSYVSATQIKVSGFVVPQGKRGSFAVTVVNPNNNVSNPISVAIQLYPAPTLFSISPTSAQEGSTISTLYLYGSNFRNDTKNPPGAWLGGKKFHKCTYSSSSRLYCHNVPLTGFPQGPLQVQVRNPDGQLSAQSKTINITAPSPPRISSISPSTAVNNQTKATITINGSYFNTASVVLLGTTTQKIRYSSPSRIYLDLDVTKFKQGIYQLKVRNSIGGKNYDSNAVNFVIVDPPTPLVNYFSPMTAETGKKVTISISGQDFNSGSTVELDGVSQTIKSRSSTSLSVELDLTNKQPGKYKLQVLNGRKPGVVNYFYVTDILPPTITRINPAGINHTLSNVTVTIEGTNFHPQATVSLKGSNIVLSSRSSTRLQFSTPFPSQLYPHGSKNEILVTNPGGKSARAYLYIYNTSHPTISYTSPINRPINSSFRLYVYGKNLSGGVIYFDNQAQSTYSSSSYLYTRSNISSGSTARNATVYVIRSGLTSNIITFPIGATAAPVLSYITKPFGKAGGSVTLNLRGSNFSTSPFAKVFFDGKAYTPSGSSSSLSVSISLIGVTAGPKEVYVQNPSGQKSAIVLFSVLP